MLTHPGLQEDFRYLIKQHGGMLAKGRLLGLQFIALMENGLYFSVAKKAVAQALRIREALVNKGIPLWESVDAGRDATRVCTSWATPDAYVEAFIAAVEAL